MMKIIALSFVASMFILILAAEFFRAVVYLLERFGLWPTSDADANDGLPPDDPGSAVAQRVEPTAWPTSLRSHIISKRGDDNAA